MGVRVLQLWLDGVAQGVKVDVLCFFGPACGYTVSMYIHANVFTCVCVCVCVYVYVCLCVCVCERERERK